MEQLTSKPYQLSVWKDVYKEHDTSAKYSELGYFDEELVFIIASNDMTTEGRAININFSQGINSSTTLNFEIYNKYFDSHTQTFIDNPFFTALKNEVHLKLKYDTEWFDFTIKEIVESNIENKYTVTAIDYFVNELSKNGYDLEFSATLRNNTGRVEELGKKIVKDVDYQIDDESDILKQTIEDNLYWCQTNSQLNVTHSIDKTSYTIDSGTNFYVFYTILANQNAYFQLFYHPGFTTQAEYESVLLRDGILQDDDFEYSYHLNNVAYNEATGLPPFIASCEINKDFKAYRLIRAPRTEYDSYTGNVVDVYSKNNKLYYCSTETKYLTKDLTFVKNAINNDSEFTGTSGWHSSNTNLTYYATEYPTFQDWTENNKTERISSWSNTSKNYLYCKSIDRQNTYHMLNTSINDSPEKFYITQVNADNKVTYKGLKAGEKVAIAYKIYNIMSTSYQKFLRDDIIGIIGTYDTNYNFIQQYVKFNNPQPTLRHTLDTVFDAKQLYFHGNNNPILTEREFKTALENNDVYEKWMYQVITLTNEIPYFDTTTPSHMGFGIQIDETKGTGSHELDFYIEEIQLYRVTEYLNTEGQTEDMFPGYVPPDLQTTKIYYYFYEPGSYPDKGKPDFNDNNYIREYYEDYDKISSIEAQASNRFNLIQTLNENFECWSKINVLRNENGSIQFTDDYSISNDLEPDPNQNYYTSEGILFTPTLDNFYTIIPENALFNVDNTYYLKENFEYLPITLDDEKFNKYNTTRVLYQHSETVYEKHKIKEKYIQFKEFIGEYLEFGFAYGLNLNSIERNIDSHEIITKLIVEDNINEICTDGVCTIARSTDNPFKSQFLLNFDYYINTGLLDKNQTIDDINTFQKEYSTLQIELATLNTELNSLQASFIEVEATRTVAIEKQTHAAEEQETLKNELQLNYLQSKFKYDELPKKYDESGQLVDCTWPEVYQATSGSEIQKYVTSIVALQKIIDEATQTISDPTYNNLKTEIEYKQKLANYYVIQLKRIKTDFEKKYQSYIQEGTWKDDSYYDDNLYYYGALNSLYISKSPKTTYNISVVDISSLKDYDVFKYHIGDKTYVSDPEIFGNKKEEVIITELSINVDDPTQNSITVQNYKTEFADLFQKFASSTIQVEYNGPNYQRTADIISTAGINANYLNQSLSQNGVSIAGAGGQLVWSNDGITTISGEMVINNNGIKFNKDGKLAFQLNSDGISADSMSAGTLDADQITIGPASAPNFKWNRDGLNAYSITESDETNFNKFVRFDQYGLYGVDGNEHFVPSDIDDIEENANFGLVWDKFFLKSAKDGSEVKISSDNAIQVFKSKESDTPAIEIDTKGIKIYAEEGKETESEDGTTFKATLEGDVYLEGKIESKSGHIGSLEIDANGLNYDVETEAGESVQCYITPEYMGWINTEFNSKFIIDDHGFRASYNQVELNSTPSGYKATFADLTDKLHTVTIKCDKNYWEITGIAQFGPLVDIRGIWHNYTKYDSSGHTLAKSTTSSKKIEFYGLSPMYSINYGTAFKRRPMVFRWNRSNEDNSTITIRNEGSSGFPLSHNDYSNYSFHFVTVCPQLSDEVTKFEGGLDKDAVTLVWQSATTTATTENIYSVPKGQVTISSYKAELNNVEDPTVTTVDQLVEIVNNTSYLTVTARDKLGDLTITANLSNGKTGRCEVSVAEEAEGDDSSIFGLVPTNSLTPNVSLTPSGISTSIYQDPVQLLRPFSSDRWTGNINDDGSITLNSTGVTSIDKLTMQEGHKYLLRIKYKNTTSFYADLPDGLHSFTKLPSADTEWKVATYIYDPLKTTSTDMIRFYGYRNGYLAEPELFDLTAMFNFRDCCWITNTNLSIFTNKYQNGYYGYNKDYYRQYKLLDYIESTGSQFINLNYYYWQQINDDYELDMELTNMNYTGIHNYGFGGGGDDYKEGRIPIISTISGFKDFYYSENYHIAHNYELFYIWSDKSYKTYYNDKISLNPYQRFKFYYSNKNPKKLAITIKDETYYINDSYGYIYTDIDYETYNDINNSLLLGIKDNFYSCYKVYGFYSYDQEGNLKRNCIPAYNYDTQRAGLLDTINNIFYDNFAGGEDFICGSSTGAETYYLVQFNLPSEATGLYVADEIIGDTAYYNNEEIIKN